LSQSDKPERERIEVHVGSLEEAPEAVARAAQARRGEKPAEDRDWLHMCLVGEDRARLKRILAHLLTLDGAELADNESVSFAGAARYAFRKAADSLPAQLKEMAGG
jgi:hypothetical protein